MFSGIVEGLVDVTSVNRGTEGMRLQINLGAFAEDVRIGDSISVNGTCLTVARLDNSKVEFDLVAETLAKTCLGDLQPGSRANVERSLKIGDRLHGHFVQGHVDGVGRIAKLQRGEEGGSIEIETSRTLTSQMISKGSVAVDGISLTLVDIAPGRFTIALIPHTLDITTLGLKGPGDRVNIEVDMVGKWVRRILVPDEE